MSDYWYDEPPLRTLTCRACKHCLLVSNIENGIHTNYPKRNKCEITKREGNLERGKWCKHFKFRQLRNAFADDGTPIRNRQPEDYRTRNQWREVGRYIKPNEVDKGKEMYANRNNMKTKYTYYLPEQTFKSMNGLDEF